MKAALLTFLLMLPAWCEPLQFLLEREMDAVAPTSSLAVAVVREGQVIFTRAVGLADRGQKLAATPATRYRIGSITKVFTALAIMQLVESGRLSLDDRLDRFQAGFPDVTIRQLLQHRSGIPNYLDRALTDGSVAGATTPAAIVEAVLQKPSEFTPGSRYSYSNTNYLLLGLIVEKLTGQPLHDYYAAHLFQPAGMLETCVGTAPSGVPQALGYRGGQVQDPGHISWYYACGDLTSTVGDLARFNIALMEGRLVKPETLALMQAQSHPTGSALSRYGLGFQINPLGQRTLAGHHGGLPGFESDDEMCLADRFAVVVLSNDYDFSTGRILGVVLANCYPADLQSAQAQLAAQRSQREQPELTTRFSTFLRQLLAGNFSRHELAEPMQVALGNPATLQALRNSLAKLGDFQKLEFLSDDETVPGFHSFRYQAVFSEGRQPLTFVLDANNKLAGLQTR